MKDCEMFLNKKTQVPAPAKIASAGYVYEDGDVDGDGSVDEDGTYEDQEAEDEYDALEAVENEWLDELEEESCKELHGDNPQKEKLEPEVITLFEHFLRYDKGQIFEELTRMMWEGQLGHTNCADGFYKEEPGQPRLQVLPNYNAWRIDRDQFILDIMVELEIGVIRDACEEGTEFFQFCISVPYKVDDYNYLTDFEGATYDDLPERDLTKLDSWGIPIYNLADINKWAEDAWWSHLHLDENSDISESRAIELARSRGLTVVRLKLVNMPETRSMLFWFDSTIVALVDGRIRRVRIPAHTIVINDTILQGRNCTREILHEVFHDDNHYIFFRTQAMYNNDIRMIKMVKPCKSRRKPMKNRLPLIEWQARMGSLALQMPEKKTRIQIETLKVNERKYSDHWGQIFERIAFTLSDDLNIPRYLVRRRMLHLGYWQSRGALNWIDVRRIPVGILGKGFETSHYATPYMFSRANCPSSRYSYFIGPDQFVKLYKKNEEFYRRIESGGYVYVDGHVCIQDPIFVETTGNGIRLTDWANRHVDLCCMRFVNIFEIDDSGYEFKLECVHADEEYCKHYVEWIANSEGTTKQEINKARSAFIRSLPDTPGEMISRLMKENGWVKIEEMAERAMVSVGTVKNWRRTKEKLTLENAVRIIIALHLPPWIQTRFLEVAGVKLGYSEYDLAIKEVLDCNYMDDMGKVNEIMTANGQKPFSEIAA